MSYVAKKVRTRYLVGEGKNQKYVGKGTAGARRMKQKSDDYYGFWINDAGKKESIRFKNVREKSIAQAALHKHLAQLGRFEAGLAPHPKEAARWDHALFEAPLQAYLAHLRYENASPRYVAEVERQSRVVIEGLAAKVIADLTSEKVSAFLSTQ